MESIAPPGNSLLKSAGPYWRLIVSEGVLMCVLGLSALITPFLNPPNTPLLVGTLILTAGIFGVLSTLLSPAIPGYWWSIISAIITVLFGLLFLMWNTAEQPLLNATLAGFLATDGILCIGIAADHRLHQTAKWWLLLASGTASIGCAAFIAIWPVQSNMITVLVIVGSDLIVSGATLLGVAYAARQEIMTALSDS